MYKQMSCTGRVADRVRYSKEHTSVTIQMVTAMLRARFVAQASTVDGL